jgi:hypothetical protein
MEVIPSPVEINGLNQGIRDDGGNLGLYPLCRNHDAHFSMTDLNPPKERMVISFHMYHPDVDHPTTTSDRARCPGSPWS